jgi:hypothetical protein
MRIVQRIPTRNHQTQKRRIQSLRIQQRNQLRRRRKRQFYHLRNDYDRKR